MNILKKHVVNKHQKISDNAVSLFQDTLDKLDKADEGIEKDIIAARTRAEEALGEEEALILIQSKNETLSNKIKEFFGDI